MIEYIDRHYRNALSAEQLSTEVDLNIKILRAGIKKKTGFMLHEYHFKVRIEKSKALLFKNESHFCQKFKQLTTMTPNEFRYLSEEAADKLGELRLHMKAVLSQ